MLPPMFGDTHGRRIGEVWFNGEYDLSLLAKYIFTSEPLSIQNHPSDDQARIRGFASGKEECWYVLDAEPGATLGLGFRRQVDREEIREAALDGSIVELIDWKPVQAGDFYYVPAGTVHAIGAGISLLEFQQNADVTYRLYDYGRPRELHLDDGLSVASTAPYTDGRTRKTDPNHSTILVNGPFFSLAHIARGDSIPAGLSGRRRWVLPLDEPVWSRRSRGSPGECLLLDATDELEPSQGRMLIGVEGTLERRMESRTEIPQLVSAL